VCCYEWVEKVYRLEMSSLEYGLAERDGEEVCSE
jgi:hypothetical protein